MHYRAPHQSSPQNIHSKILLSLLLGTTLASAAVTNGSFEAGQAGWGVTGNAEAQSAGSLYTATTGEWLMTFNSGQAIPNGVVSQIIPTLIGGKYRIDFDYGALGFNNNRQEIEVTAQSSTQLGSAQLAVNAPGGGNTTWKAGSLSFTATHADTMISFADKSGTVTDSIDLTLDNVRITLIEAPIGETVELDLRVQGVESMPISFSSPTVTGALTAELPSKVKFPKGATVSITTPTEGFHSWIKNTSELTTSPTATLNLPENMVLTAAYTPAVSPAQIQLAWNPNPETDLAGYWVYHRTGSQTFENCPKTWVAAPATTATVGDLVRGQTYEFACRAQNRANVTSALSTTVLYTPAAEIVPQGRIVILESETGIITNPYATRNEGGIGWVEASMSLGGSITHNFEAPQAAGYYVWVKSAPSLYQEEEACNITLGNQTHPFTPGDVQPGWTWKRLTDNTGNPVRIHLEASPQTLRVQQLGGSTTQVLAPGETSIHNVSSQETTQENNAGANALDGNPATIWHTKWDDAAFPPPHQISLKLSGMKLVSGIQYTPRQDGVSNGHITGYKVLTSQDGTTWTERASGTWAANADVKTASFPAVDAIYVRLATTNTADRWASAAEIRVLAPDAGTNAGPKLDKIILTTEAELVPDDTLKTGTIRILEQPQSQTIQPGQTLRLACKAVSTEPIRFQWVKNNQALSTETENPLTRTGFDAGDAGTYRVLMETSTDTAASSTASVGLPTLGQPIQKANVTMAPNGMPELHLEDAPIGTLVHIRATSNLVDWERIQTTVVNGEPIPISDPHPGPRRFYSAEYQR